ncbi:metallophosphoesterase family protein [Methylibium petroleiphilum]|uniref:metallophosphoesterase family protein n=1 Tax=Methylibium petroleiphilum TaxID=105560 RepID=UPI003D2AA615
MTLAIQISDPHFGTEQPAVVEALLQLVREQAPDVAVLSGDITQRASRAQFRAARAFVDRLGTPVTLVIPGNHDIPLFNPLARLFAPYANHRQAFGAELEPMAAWPDLLLLTVNTTRPWRHKDGEVSDAQVARVAAQLHAAQPGQLRVVVVHQPLAVTREEDEPNRLHRGAEAARAWSQAGADLVLGGHIHLPFVLPLHERFEALARPLWAVQAGTAVSRRVRDEAGNSVNLVRSRGRVGPRREALVERWDYRAASQRFEPVSMHRLGFEVGSDG